MGVPLPLGDDGAQFLVTIDTEEAFDWDGPFTRDQHSVTHIPAVIEFQTICEDAGVKPVYLVDFPVINDPASAELFRTLAAEGRAVIGAHLHPWVTPPFTDSISRRNSYGCNLPAEVERDKLMVMLDTMDRIFGETPTIFRAGRYGVGANTLEILAANGVRFDSSVRSSFDYSAEGGPDFHNSPARPYWIRPNVLAELPLTSVFVGPLRGYASHLFGKDSKPAASRGLLSRARMLNRIPFTPEGVGLSQMKKGIDRALADGLPLLTLSFHSPSLVPGNTSYVRNEAERVAFLQWWREILAYFSARRVRPAQLDQLWDTITG